MTAARRAAAFRVGVAVGAGIGLAARYLTRRAERDGHGLVDWERAAATAESRLRRAPGSLTAAELRASEPAYTAAMERIVPLLEVRLGAPLPGVVERHAVVDRAGWARANVATFQQLIGRVEQQLQADDGTPLGAGVAGMANRFIATRQVAFLLSYLGSRVLGQYDLALLSAEARPGRLLFVEENIRATASAIGVPLGSFRTWIALHETTHAFELEAHPWVRPYLSERVEHQLAGFLAQARGAQDGGLAAFVRRMRSGQGDFLARLLPPEQRESLREIQVVMSLLEGFGDWVMDDAGAQLLPDVTLIRQRFEARRDQRRGVLDRVIGRLIGLDMKLEQYRRGERFVAGVAATGGRAAVARLWDGPQTLPTDAELSDPASWVRRVAPETIRTASAW